MTSGNSKSFVGFRLGGPAFVAVLAVAVLAATLGGPAPARAGEEQITVEEVMAKYIEALGGEAALKKLHNRVTKGTMEVGAQELAMKVTVYEAEPNLSYVVIESEAMGKVEKGTDGKVVWSKHPVYGPQLKEGDELHRALHDATFHSDLKWRELYKTVELTGTEEVDGKPCYKIAATPQVGQAETWYIDKESHLKVRGESILTGPMGQIPIVSLHSDFKKVGGVVIPHKMVQEIAMQKIVLTITSIEHNVDLPKDRFDLPEEVKSLVAIQEETKEAEKEAEKETKQVE